MAKEATTTGETCKSNKQCQNPLTQPQLPNAQEITTKKRIKKIESN
jgi:hypothetical protein